MRVEEAADGASEQGAYPVHPLIRPEAGGQGRAESSGRVERRAGECPPCQYITRQRQSDRQPRKPNGSAGMHGGSEDDDHQEEGHEPLEDHPRHGAHAGREGGRTQVGFGRSSIDGPEEERPQRGADELRDPVGDSAAEADPAPRQHPHGHGRIEVATGDVSERVDHDQDREPVSHGDPRHAHHLGRVVGEDRPGSKEDQGEGTDQLGQELLPVHPSSLPFRRPSEGRLGPGVDPPRASPRSYGRAASSAR